jgi:hypothetical protein
LGEGLAILNRRLNKADVIFGVKCEADISALSDVHERLDHLEKLLVALAKIVGVVLVYETDGPPGGWQQGKLQ